MATNFRISMHRNCESLHLKLMGDFDGSSAHELLEVLKRNSHGIVKAFIHTSSLKDLHPFGRNVFLSNLDFMEGKSISMMFTGTNAERLAPEWGKSS
jgi:hypothetical protein